MITDFDFMTVFVVLGILIYTNGLKPVFQLGSTKIVIEP